MRECVNPHAVAFPLWICVRLNFSRGGRQGAIGHSVNVSGSEQPELRQPYAVACHSLCLCLCAVYFLLSPHFPRLPYPALFHTFIIVFYLCLTIACRKIAHPVIDKAGFSLCVSLFLSPFLRISVGPKSTSSLSVSRYSVSQIIQDSCYPALFHPNLLSYHYFALLVIRFFFLLQKELLFSFILQNHLQFPWELSREGSFI